MGFVILVLGCGWKREIGPCRYSLTLDAERTDSCWKRWSCAGSQGGMLPHLGKNSYIYDGNYVLLRNILNPIKARVITAEVFYHFLIKYVLIEGTILFKFI